MRLKKLKAPGMWQVSAMMDPEPGSDQDIPIAIRFRADSGSLAFRSGSIWGCPAPAGETWSLEQWLEMNEEEILGLLGG